MNGRAVLVNDYVGERRGALHGALWRIGYNGHHRRTSLTQWAVWAVRAVLVCDVCGRSVDMVDRVAEGQEPLRRRDECPVTGCEGRLQPPPEDDEEERTDADPR